MASRLTRGEILDEALNRAGLKKLKERARVRLNTLLEDLYRRWEWPFLYKEVTVVLSGATLTLPSDFLKTESRTTGLVVTAIDGLPARWPVTEYSPQEWRERAFPRDQEGTRPDIWRIDYATLLGYLWPTVTLARCDALLVYKHLPADVSPDNATTYDADIPLFPYASHLAREMERWARSSDNDPGARDLYLELYGADGISGSFGDLRGTAIPAEAIPDTIPLDPTVFRPAFRNESDDT